MNKKTLSNEFFSKVIDKMAEIDQVSRNNVMNNMGRKQMIYSHIVYLIDAVNGFRIKELIKKFGYPTKAKIGEASLRNFWLLIQHQDFDLDLQEKCLRNCDFAPKNKAYLTDRILINSGKKQLYGTQFHKDKNGILKPLPIQDPKNIDKRRKRAGLESLEKYAKQMIERNFKK